VPGTSSTDADTITVIDPVAAASCLAWPRTVIQVPSRFQMTTTFCMRQLTQPERFNDMSCQFEPGR